MSCSKYWIRIQTWSFLVKDEKDEDDCEYEDIDNEEPDEIEKEIHGDLNVDESGEEDIISENMKLKKAVAEVGVWAEVIEKFKDIASITHDSKSYCWLHIVYNRRSEAEKVDLVHVISGLVIDFRWNQF